jgi:transporter family-2 protein
MPLVNSSILIVLLAGAMIALQGPINAMLARGAGTAINASLISFAVGTIALAAIAAAQRVAPATGALRALPWWAWLGGLCGAIFVTAVAHAAPRIGVANTLTLAVASQLVMAVVLDATGALGLAQRPVSLGRVAGIALVLTGAWLVRRG